MERESFLDVVAAFTGTAATAEKALAIPAVTTVVFMKSRRETCVAVFLFCVFFFMMSFLNKKQTKPPALMDAVVLPAFLQ
jgi:hypothetical protein